MILKMLMTLVFDVSGSKVDVADVFDKSEAVSGVQLVEVSQVWLAGVPLPEAAVYLLPRDERSVHDADLAVRVLDVEDNLLLGDDVLLPHLPLIHLPSLLPHHLHSVHPLAPFLVSGLVCLSTGILIQEKKLFNHFTTYLHKLFWQRYTKHIKEDSKNISIFSYMLSNNNSYTGYLRHAH